jgi:hypothetical protein
LYRKNGNSDQNVSTNVCVQIQPVISEMQNDNKTQLFADVENTKLNVSVSPIKENDIKIQSLFGRRIVDIAYIFEQIVDADNHKPFDCSFKDMVCVNEKRDGLISSFKFICLLCKTRKVINSEKKVDEEVMNLNTAIVAGNMNVGAGFSQLETITCAIEIPPMSQYIYDRHHTIVCMGYERAAANAMEEAAKEEAELAILSGNIDSDGTPLITVVADGSWCKRSYRTMYNSLSGTVST